jgi:hypothetical protein
MLIACCSKRAKISQKESHTTAFENLSGNITGHLHVPGVQNVGGGWFDIPRHTNHFERQMGRKLER